MHGYMNIKFMLHLTLTHSLTLTLTLTLTHSLSLSLSLSCCFYILLPILPDPHHIWYFVVNLKSCIFVRLDILGAVYEVKNERLCDRHNYPFVCCYIVLI